MHSETNAWWIKPNEKRGLLDITLNMILFVPLVLLVSLYKLLGILYELRNSFRKTN
jgi:hypothetical protein